LEIVNQGAVDLIGMMKYSI